MRQKLDNLIQVSASISIDEKKTLKKRARKNVLSQSGYIRKIIAEDVKKEKK